MNGDEKWTWIGWGTVKGGTAAKGVTDPTAEPDLSVPSWLPGLSSF